MRTIIFIIAAVFYALAVTNALTGWASDGGRYEVNLFTHEVSRR